MADPQVREIGRLADGDGAPIVVGVDYGWVTVQCGGGSPGRLHPAAMMEFARLFGRACYVAGLQEGSDPNGGGVAAAGVLPDTGPAGGL
jgi:hypothetical protein